MHSFEFTRPENAAEAINLARNAKAADVRFVAGGTTLIDRMKLGVESPTRLLDINRLPFDQIEDAPDGGPPKSAKRLFSSLPSDSFGSFDPAAQHGHHRREPATENALCILPRYCHAMQQT